MLNESLILQDTEELLADHYAWLQRQHRGQVGVYETPQQAPMTTPAPSPSLVKANPIGEFLANVFVFFLLSAVTDKLANR
jgi:hypothetical protein